MRGGRVTEKKAFLVVGSQASGTRMMTEILINAGCYGDSGHQQRLDHTIPEREPLIVWRRSFPHDNDWHNVGDLAKSLHEHGYTVKTIVMSRDWYAMARSQMKEPYGADYAPDMDTALLNIQRAYRLIFEDMPTPFRLVNYEALVARPQQATAKLLESIGLSAPARCDIYDGNQKYYE